LRASLNQPITPQLVATATLGSEANDLGGVRKSYDNYGVSAVWRPSDRTTLNADVMERYFGTGYGVSLEQRGARTVWRYSARRDAVTAPIATTASLGSLYDLLDNYYRSYEPDPLRRAALVEAELQKSGLPANQQVQQNLLTSTVSLRDSQQLSLMLLGQRGTLALTLSRGTTSRLQANPLVPDDLTNQGSISNKGWSGSYAHRLTPLTSLTATLGSQRNEGSAVAGAATVSTARNLLLSLGTRINTWTSASLNYRRGLYEASGKSTSDNALSANLTLWF